MIYGNLLTTRLGEVLSDNPLQEKRLIAPTVRIGFQWLDVVTRSGRSVFNVHVNTLRHLALDAALPEMERLGYSYLSNRQAEVLVYDLFTEQKHAGPGYLTRLEAGPGLIRSLLRTLQDVRLSGITADDLDASVFEVREKGEEIRSVLRSYEQRLNEQSLVDYADILRLACRCRERGHAATENDVLLLVPHSLHESLLGLEKQYLELCCGAHVEILPEDGFGDPPRECERDAELLQWIGNPAEAPQPVGDGSVDIFRAVGEVNEVNGVFRKCAENGIPLDDVEVVHTDAHTYVPLLYEQSLLLADEVTDFPPVTFAEGIPTAYSRPGKALIAWLEWIREGFPQAVAARMIQDGLVVVNAVEGREFSFSGPAALLRSVPIGGGADRYVFLLEREIAACRSSRADEDHAGDTESAERSRREEALGVLRDFFSRLLEITPQPDASPAEVLEKARTFVDSIARTAGKTDEYAAGKLLKDIDELLSFIGKRTDSDGPDVRQWLAELPHTAHILGQGPRPGCLFVAPIHLGGHSGRSRLFVLGLDDSRFPGTGSQDPLLLDSERIGLSSELVTGASRVKAKEADFVRLTARARGQVALSYCSQSLSDDRELFPGPVLLSAYRVISGDHRADLDTFLRNVTQRFSFAPDEETHCLCRADLLVYHLCRRMNNTDQSSLVGRLFPHLFAGSIARSHRDSDAFTEYDGYVPEAGVDHDPTAIHGPIMSSTRLETLGRCPLEYFFRYALRIQPPKEYAIDPAVWLDPLQKGSLLHEVFRTFMAELRDSDELPEFDLHHERLTEILDETIARYETEVPVPNETARDVSVQELRTTARIFLQEEEQFCVDRKPAFFEASIGMHPEGSGTELDRADPVTIVLPGDITFKAYGRIDRIDELPGGSRKRFGIWDYKTGGAGKYNKSDPFREGRHVQNVLYQMLVEKVIKEQISLAASVDEFGYFFPAEREHGLRIAWQTSELVGGTEVLRHLIDILRNGAFCFSTNPNDVTYSDYLSAFGDIEASAIRTAMKMENPDNVELEPFRNLRT